MESTSRQEWNSSTEITSANINDSGEYICVVSIFPNYTTSTFIVPSQMVSESVALTIGELPTI